MSITMGYKNYYRELIISEVCIRDVNGFESWHQHAKDLKSLSSSASTFTVGEIYALPKPSWRNAAAARSITSRFGVGEE